MTESHQYTDVDLTITETSFDAACDAMVDIIVEIIEGTLARSDGARLHEPACIEVDLIPHLIHDTIES
jgi:hypothetical protein